MGHEWGPKGVLRRNSAAHLAGAELLPMTTSPEIPPRQLLVRQMELEIQNQALRHAKNALEASRDRYVDLFESAPVAYVILSRDGRVIEANRLAGQLLALPQARLLQRFFEEFVAPTDLERWREQSVAAWAGRATAPRDYELLLRNADDARFPAQLEWVVLADDQAGPTMRLAFFDITGRSESAAHVHRLAYFDPLTHLPNRRLLLDRLAQTLAASARTGLYGAILFLDLDNFKVLNDSRGHGAGDRLLGEVGQRLRSGLREGDTVARMGGDEFVVILDSLGPTREAAALLAQTIGEKLRQSIAQPFDLGEFGFHCTASIGARLFGPGEKAAELLQHADLALYGAKSAGRNRVRFFDLSMQAALDARGVLENALREALRKEQFALHYQPRLDVAGRVVGAESLLRWRHPERGLMLPGDFLALAGQTGLILPIGRWVLETACARLASWSRDPDTRALTLAVNISAPEFRQAHFVDQVRQALESSGASPEKLTLELTEGAVLDTGEEAVTCLRQLSEIGVRFSVDDFGKGWSPLSRLTRLPLKEIKIDRSLVPNVDRSGSDATLVSAIITLARSLGLTAVAEGVETEAQHRVLASHGCDTFQGFLFSPPLPPEDFLHFLRGSRGGAPASPATVLPLQQECRPS
jgi:diguanylate cyclase (GGDEF)-like protein/PAS domain S-box-containing protein